MLAEADARRAIVKWARCHIRAIFYVRWCGGCCGFELPVANLGIVGEPALFRLGHLA
jgi:hypothetical protein